jgi:hypothetical protein
MCNGCEREQKIAQFLEETDDRKEEMTTQEYLTYMNYLQEQHQEAKKYHHYYCEKCVFRKAGVEGEIYLGRPPNCDELLAAQYEIFENNRKLEGMRYLLQKKRKLIVKPRK